MSAKAYVIVLVAAAIVVAACVLHTHHGHDLLMQWLPAIHGNH